MVLHMIRHSPEKIKGRADRHALESLIPDLLCNNDKRDDLERLRHRPKRAARGALCQSSNRSRSPSCATDEGDDVLESCRAEVGVAHPDFESSAVAEDRVEAVIAGDVQEQHVSVVVSEGKVTV